MKKVLAVLVGLMMLCSVAAASPLMDYSAGKAAIDVSVYPSLDFHLTNNQGYDQSPGGVSGNIDWGLTAGLGNKFAVQYRQFNPKTVTYNGSLHEIVKLDTQELNGLYKLDKNLAGFVGYHQAKNVDYTWGNSLTSFGKNTMQVGLVGTTPIGDKFSLFGTVGVGSGLTNFEVGVAYAVTPNLDLNVLYRDLRVNGVKFNAGVECKNEVKGFGYGLTYKF